jgi:hypothetical protein
MKTTIAIQSFNIYFLSNYFVLDAILILRLNTSRTKPSAMELTVSGDGHMSEVPSNVAHKYKENLEIEGETDRNTR